METCTDNLRDQSRRLELALDAKTTGRECEWARRVSEELHDLLLALRRQADETEGPDVWSAGVDETRPTLARQADRLRREHARLLQRTAGLWVQIEKARQTPEPARRWGYFFPSATPPAPELHVLRRQAYDLLVVLRRQQERETDLLLESIATDIGVGD